MAVNLNTENAPVHYWMGASNVELGNIEEGCLHFRQAAMLIDANAKQALEVLCNVEN